MERGSGDKGCGQDGREHSGGSAINSGTGIELQHYLEENNA